MTAVAFNAALQAAHGDVGPYPARWAGLRKGGPSGLEKLATTPHPLAFLLVLIAILSCVLPLSAADPSPVSWVEGPGYRSTRLAVPDSGRAGFTRLSPEVTGVRFTNALDNAALARNQILEVGSGVALGDVDGDGRVDIYFCSMNGTNRLYRNLGGWRFEDVTQAAGVGCPGQFSTGSVLADVDGDGDLDLLVNAIGGGTRLFVNQGAGRFREAPDYGLVREHGSTSMALGDIDGDGFLDLYVANYHTRTFKDSPPGLEIEAGYVNGKFVIKPPGLFFPLFLKSGGVSLFERGEADILYRNDGHGRFVPLSWTNGTFLDPEGRALAEPPKDWAWAVAFRDLNGDGAPDLYVCNDFFSSPDHIWLNDGAGKFRALPRLALRHTSMASMAVDFADINRDGHDDFLVLDMMSRDHARRQRQRGSLIHVQVETPIQNPLFRPEYPRNTLFLNRGDGTYAEIAQYSGVEASEWSWSVAFLDVDLDGYEDVLITNGNLRDANDADLARSGAGPVPQPATPAGQRRNLRFPPLETANVAFRNQGDLTFEERGKEWGFDTLGVSHGMALADLDNDGDLDVIINHMHQPAGLYRNDTGAPRVAVRAVGKSPNAQGIGARIELRHGAVASQSQEIIAGGRYLSGDDPLRVFAAGAPTNRMTLQVTWRNGTKSWIEDVRPNHLYEVREAGAASSSNRLEDLRAPAPSVASAPGQADAPGGKSRPFFEDVSAKLRYPHQEEEFNDFERQPLLPRLFSRLGPGVAWRDLDGDGWEDLIVGGARKGFQVVYLNNGQGEFKAMRRKDPPIRDQTSVLTLRSPEGGTELLAGSANYEDGPGQGEAGMVLLSDLERGTESAIAPAQPWSVGPLALGLIGTQPALFVGGRVRPGRYPEPASSQLYVREKGSWRLDRTNSDALAGTGLVSGAVWTDLNGDGRLELVLACEWGPLRVFELKTPDGILNEITKTLRLDTFLGWWNGIASGDFDGDGRLDLLASNWGRNTRYQRHRAKPVRLYYGNWQDTDRVELLEAYYEPTQRRYVPFLTLDALRLACPRLAEKYPTFAAYALAGAEDVPGVDAARVSFLEANWLETTLFLNRGDHFDAKPLPAEAQMSPAFGVSIGDFDGDGNEDAFLSQNFFGVDPETTRHDAGRGLWLRGDGQGGLAAVPGQQSGVRLDGEQRGCALCDYDKDGRVDLVVGQNRGASGLFRNVTGHPGLRVRVQGPAWNPDGIGAIIRLKYAKRTGPARLIQIGSGYWSQESVVQVLGAPEPPVAISVRWPGGTGSEHALRPGDREVTVRPANP